MKKLMSYALAILLALVVAVPADAGGHGRNDRGRRHSRSRSLTLRIEDHYRHYYEPYYPYRVGVPQIDIMTPIYGSQLRYDDNHREAQVPRDEAPSECFLRVVERARPEDAMAFCSGQPLPARQVEVAQSVAPAPKRPAPMYRLGPKAEATPAAKPEVTKAASATPQTCSFAPPWPIPGVRIEQCRVCNDDSTRNLTVLVDGKEVGTIPPGKSYSLAHLPEGQPSFRY